MREFLYDTFICPFEEGDYFLGILIWLIGILLSALTLGITLGLSDSLFRPEYTKEGTITSLYIKKAHYSTTYTHAGKVTIPVTTYHPKKFYVKINIDDLYDDVSVTQEYYNTANIGDKVICKYTKGRIFNTLYIGDIYSKK